jgi:tripartite-type tricarboxylate transporter receptor subunit TctC
MSAFRRLLQFLAVSLIGLPMPGAQAKEASTTAPIRLIVPFAAGGPSDVLARKIGEKLGERLKRSVVIDNRTGGGGAIAASAVARAEPDGNTILWATTTNAIDPVLRPSLNYDVQKDLTPIVTALVSPLTIMVNPKLPAKNIAELVAYARANPGKLNFGSAGVGTSLHLGTERFMLDSGIQMTHIPYKGASQTIVALISNDIQVMLTPIPTALQYGKTGEARVLAVTTPKRSSILPDLPAVAESGVPGLAHFNANIWYGLYAPAKTPKAVIDNLNKAVVASLKDASTQKWLGELGIETLGDTPEQARKMLATEIREWGEVVRKINIKVE